MGFSLSDRAAQQVAALQTDYGFSTPEGHKPGARAIRPEAAAGGVNIMVDALPDWTLRGHRTLQVSLSPETSACEILLNEEVVLPARALPLRFEAALACHRAQAGLRLTVEQADGRQKHFDITFDKDKTGGTAAEGYAHVSQDLGTVPEGSRVRLSLLYAGFRGAPAEGDAFLFLAAPRLVRTATSASQPKAVFVEGAPGAPGADQRWYEAGFSGYGLAPEEAVTLEAAGRKLTLLEPDPTKVDLLADYGHTLVISASRHQTYLIYLNGKIAVEMTIGEGENVIRVPQKYMTGGTYHMTVRDQAGNRTYLETYITVPWMLTPTDVLQRETGAPFNGEIFAQATDRYKALQAHLSGTADPVILPQISHALSVLEAGYDKLKLAPIAFPEVAEPDVSIIIPCHNKVAVTYYGLCALLLAKNEASFEVILVDDASTDETAEIETFVSGIRVLRNEEPQRFIRACNAGVAAARGQYVVLLNNDTEPTAGWLDALIDGLRRFKGAGLVGSKLIYPNGELQDAGGIVWGSGDPWNYGNHANRYDPRFNYARQVDYLSGAALMTTREIWDEVGGLSAYLEPMYFEDTDFSFKVRDAGYKTYYIPSSVVYHFEGMTSGTDTSAGYKRYQEVNRPKFKRAWAKAYSGGSPVGVLPDLEKDRGIKGRVLFIDHSTPRPDRDAGGYAAIQEIRLVQSLGYKVTFLPENMAYLGSYSEELQRMGVEIVHAPFHFSAADFIAARGGEFDAFYVTRYNIAAKVVGPLRQANPQARIIMNNADLHFLRKMRGALAQNDPEALEAARKVRDEELEVMQVVDVVLSYNEVEHSVIQSHTEGKVQVLKCPWVVDVQAEVPTFELRSGLSFLGSFGHHPNAEGVMWFAREVMPLLENAVKDMTFSIYGSGMTDEIKALASARIAPIGFVQNIADAYNRHRVFVAPLLSGAGLKGKVLSALAHGVPCVLTPTAAEGIGLRHGHDCLIVNSPIQWADAINSLHNDKDMWQSLSENALLYVEQAFSFEKGRDDMRAAFEAIDLYNFNDQA